MRRLLLFIICACLYACAPQKPLVQTIETVRTEREIIRDTTVLIKPDSAQVRALLECDSLNRVIVRELQTAQGARITPTVTHTYVGANKSDGINAHIGTDAGALLLRLDCKEDSLEYELQVRDKVIEQLKSEKHEIAVPYVPDYYRNTSNGFWVLLALLILIVGIRIAIWYFGRK